MKKFLKILFFILSALYPVMVFTMLVVFKLPVRILALCMMALGFAFFLNATGRGKGVKGRSVVPSVLFLLAGTVCFVSNQAIFLKLYSVAISATFLVAFGSTLFFPPSIIFRFAALADKSIIDSPRQKAVESYCKKVCIVWCMFFIINGFIAAFTAFSCSYAVWSVYTGFISYILMGMLFAFEFIVRRFINKKMEGVYTISTFRADSRPDDYILCYENIWSEKSYKTWLDFLTDTAKMRSVISQFDSKEFILHCEDYWYFLVTFAALLQCKKTVLLTQNISEAFIKEIKGDGVTFFTDQQAADSVHIPSVIENCESPSENQIRTAPAFSSDETKILMYTSGSTGKPKGVRQRMTEFEKDNAFIIEKWGDEFRKRRLVTTVSQHHIYGFLFGISLPFSLGVPFRRNRIEFPEEFESLQDSEYMIIATPAFLKRTVDVEDKLPLKNCFIFTSGGVLTPEVAKRTDEVFGFWPLEVYGSTETSGIAYRQSKNGLAWTPFDNAKVWKGDDGCLVIISPYIKDPAGFATADLVDINDDGTFFLRGRIDSIVKIEEKRISMTEVENRIVQTGLVADVKVIAMEDRRQYLAAAVELNDEGKKKFEGEKKLVLNNFFHDYLMQYFENVVIPKKWRFVDRLPADVQGKKHKEDIKALFEVQE
ncbi:MAG: AMP-binding protein [Treponema sp.]|nr:AMP-binding protein [Treponema sp.]